MQHNPDTNSTLKFIIIKHEQPPSIQAAHRATELFDTGCDV